MLVIMYVCMYVHTYIHTYIWYMKRNPVVKRKRVWYTQPLAFDEVIFEVPATMKRHIRETKMHCQSYTASDIKCNFSPRCVRRTDYRISRLVWIYEIPNGPLKINRHHKNMTIPSDMAVVPRGYSTIVTSAHGDGGPVVGDGVV
jgi:hypothetical protein